MKIDVESVDVDKLRKDLIEHFAAAMFIVSPVAMLDLSKVERVSNEEIIKIAIENKFDLNKYLRRFSK